MPNLEENAGKRTNKRAFQTAKVFLHKNLYISKTSRRTVVQNTNLAGQKSKT